MECIADRGAENGYNGYKLYRTNWLPLDSLDLESMRNLSYCRMAGQNYVQLSNAWTVLCPTVQWLDSIRRTVLCPLSNGRTVLCPLSNGQTVLCPTVQLSDSAVSNCPIVRQCRVQLSNDLTVLYSTVQWPDNAVSNCLMVKQCFVHCPMVGQCCVQLSNGRTLK